ncbi:hypothetical protein [Brucella pituitosa]|uniref:hypothetical protein n=1 Tax=Brucella pituitosa TaxID=571256 RepID=UPI003F493E0E
MLDRLNASAAEKPAPVLERDLHYVSDSEPGIQRLRCGAGFRYKGVGAGRVSAGDIERIKALAIPPAWQDVWICAHPNGHIQATGRDLRGRKQYRYHSEWSAMQGETKFSSLGDFATVLSSLRRQVEADMRRRSLCREKSDCDDCLADGPVACARRQPRLCALQQELWRDDPAQPSSKKMMATTCG